MKTTLTKTIIGVLSLAPLGAARAQAQVLPTVPTGVTVRWSVPDGTYVNKIKFTPKVAGSKLTPNTKVCIQFRDANGVNVGAPVTERVDPVGDVTVPTEDIPTGARTKGCGFKLVACGTTPAVTIGGPVVWDKCALMAQAGTGGLKVGMLGLPGNSAGSLAGFVGTEPWFACQSEALGNSQSPVTSSLFRLAYSAPVRGMVKAHIAGDDSFAQLANGLRITFQDGEPFGDFQLEEYGLQSDAGVFDFPALGMSGTWSWVLRGNTTLAMAHQATSFTGSVVALRSEKPTVTEVTLDPSRLLSGRSTIGTVYVDQIVPEGGWPVELISSNPKVVGVPEIVLVPAGGYHIAFSIETAAVRQETHVTITARFNGEDKTVTLDLLPALILK